jgi:hypothetical protein
LFVVFVAAFLACTSIVLPRLEADAEEPRQQPTGSIATVTSTLSGPVVVVNPDQDQINIRSGPGTDYPALGVVIAGQELIALGRSAQGLWIMIRYFGVPGDIGWVYAPLVSSPTGNLPIIEPPPTPTPNTTPTIDPTLAAEFILEQPPTRLPTFTPPPPVVYPTIEVQTVGSEGNGIPMGLLIIGLAVLGIFGGFLSVLRGR